MHELSLRPTDRTEYVTWAAADFKDYWTQRISAEIVMADARRCLDRLVQLRQQARERLNALHSANDICLLGPSFNSPFQFHAEEGWMSIKKF